MANVLVDGSDLLRVLQRTKSYVDKTAAPGGGNLKPWLEANIGDAELPLGEGGNFEIGLTVDTSADPADFCGIRLTDGMDNCWEFPFMFHSDDRSENLCALYYDYARLWQVEYIAPTLFFTNVTPKRVTAGDFYLKFSAASPSDIASALTSVGTAVGRVLEVRYSGKCPGMPGDYLGISLSDSVPNYYMIPFTRFNEDGSRGWCDCFAYDGKLWSVEHLYGANDGLLRFTRVV